VAMLMTDFRLQITLSITYGQNSNLPAIKQRRDEGKMKKKRKEVKKEQRRIME
jgi:hypothetical protein